jgi:predicted kinase
MIVLVKGLPATGKTWFSEKLAEKLNAMHLNTDKVRKEHGLTGKYDDSSRQKTYNLLFDQLEKYIIQGKRIIVDGTFHEKENQTRIVNLCHKYNSPLYVIGLKADEALIKERMARKRKYSEADFDVYMKIKGKEHPMDHDCLILNSTDGNSEQLLTQTMQYINS